MVATKELVQKIVGQSYFYSIFSPFLRNPKALLQLLLVNEFLLSLCFSPYMWSMIDFLSFTQSQRMEPKVKGVKGQKIVQLQPK